MKYLENIIGKENFQVVFRDYIIKFTNKSVSSQDYINVFNENVKRIYGEKESENIFHKIDWQKWLFTPGDVIEKIELSKLNITHYLLKMLKATWKIDFTIRTYIIYYIVFSTAFWLEKLIY